MCFKAYLFFWIFVIAIFLWNLQKDYCSALPRGTRMVIRYDKFEWVTNDKFGRVNQVYVSQYNGTDFANINMTVDVDIVLHKMTMDMIRCKEHYIDCVNYRSFEVAQFCGKEKAILFFIKMGYINRELLCTIDKVRRFYTAVDPLANSFKLKFD
ncbi:uncharacterized protein LOC126897814 [Daktulosphaira vitifoliae]|uniref:uncharacterized protein LOC126897814 n=1 Tax=Daktulosphaira vitifoliae TaxID=58002 RepID=UPI0021AAB5FD|nr:uncharacterized protein LOC126897814 [Daktulosphaira vitifoliae]